MPEPKTAKTFSKDRCQRYPKASRGKATESPGLLPPRRGGKASPTAAPKICSPPESSPLPGNADIRKCGYMNRA